MSRHDDMITLRQMLDHAKEAIILCDFRDINDLYNDRIFYLALLKLVEIVCEAATRVSAVTQEKIPQIPWRWIIGTRNRLIHGYDSIDKKILWRIATDDFLVLEGQIEEYLSE